jgi:F0F1-type ATP synthase membrane subunit c/vacuolar-type H+-ATPase subunit K
MLCPRCGGSYSGLQDPSCPHRSRTGIRNLRRALYLLAGLCLGLALLAVAILLHCLPGIWEPRQDLFRKLLVVLGLAIASGLGAFVLVFITCLAKMQQLWVQLVSSQLAR